MIMRMCGSCEQERDALRARIAELELEVAQLKGQIEMQGVKYPIGTRVVVEKKHSADSLCGPGIVMGFQDYRGWIEYKVRLDNRHPQARYFVFVPEDELTQA